MARLIYSTIASLDGYIADERGDFEWAAPDEYVHAFVNDLARRIGTHLFGRRMFEVLAVWETFALEELSPIEREFAVIWRSTDKIVYSATLPEVSTARTRLVRAFDPEEVRRIKGDAAQDLSIGGPTLAREAFDAGLVDEVHLFLVPTIVGGGLAALPAGVRQDLELLDERRFQNGTVFLRYRVGDDSA